MTLERTCEHGCNGCDQCIDWMDDEPEDDDQECPRCKGDGMDPWSDYLMPCPLCLGDAEL